jgi:fatty acid synthase
MIRPPGVVSALKPLASLLDWTVHGLQCTAAAPDTSIPALASSYLQLLRSVQPAGPLHLAGYSFGAVVAFELALQLEVT